MNGSVHGRPLSLKQVECSTRWRHHENQSHAFVLPCSYRSLLWFFLALGSLGESAPATHRSIIARIEQVEPDKGIIKLNGGMSYKYSLPAYTEDGAEVNVAFGTERELTEGRYLKLQGRPIQGVIGWQEVRFDELPPVVQEAYRR